MEMQPTIASLATGSDSFDILENVLIALDTKAGAGLVETLSGTGSFTVFAPTDAAFIQLALDRGYTGDTSDETGVTNFLAGDIGISTLLNVVLYHVSPGAKTQEELSAGPIPTLLEGATINPLLPRLQDNEPDLIDPSIVATDGSPSNGIVYAIDRVLLPVDLQGNDADTIAEIVAASSAGFDGDGTDFDMLNEAVLTADPSIAALLGDESRDLTAFAPDDDAFISLAQDLGYDGSDESGAWSYLVDALTVLSKGDPVGLLTTVLSYHVTEPALQESQVAAADGGTVDTFAGLPIGIDLPNLVDLDTDATDPSLVATDIQAANGVVHMIDEVLRPANLPDGDAIRILDDGTNFLRGSRDNDYVLAKGGHDTIIARNGDDVVLAGEGNDRVFGGRGQDHIDGGAGRDHLVGGRGNDTIDGGEGSDKLFGGRGADTFVFNEMSGHDTIVDFRGNDKIDLTAFELEGFHEVEISRGFFSAKIEVEDTSITLSFVNPNSLSEDDFLL